MKHFILLLTTLISAHTFASPQKQPAKRHTSKAKDCKEGDVGSVCQKGDILTCSGSEDEGSTVRQLIYNKKTNELQIDSIFYKPGLMPVKIVKSISTPSSTKQVLEGSPFDGQMSLIVKGDKAVILYEVLTEEAFKDSLETSTGAATVELLDCKLSEK